MTDSQQHTTQSNDSKPRLDKATKRGFHWKRWREQQPGPAQKKDTNSHPTTTSMLGIRTSRIEPEKDTKVAHPTTGTMSSTTTFTYRQDKYRGVIVDHDIDPRDGKTKECDRNHTFDTFLPHEQMPHKDEAKRMGHTWEVVRAVQRMRKLKKPLKRIASRKRKGKKGDAVEHEMLIASKD